MPKRKELWRNLRVGDRIRMVGMPPEFHQEGYHVPPETLRVYRKLLARRRSMRVWFIDEWGSPWIRCGFRRKNGRFEGHFVAMNHEGIALVKKRGQKR